MSAEQRFLLLFVCALMALFAMGLASRPGKTVASTSAGGPVPVSQAVAGSLRPAVQTAAAMPNPLLASLWSTRLADRIPLLVASARLLSPIIDNKQIISYYGNPSTPDMGVLGTADLETIGAELEARAARYDELNGNMGVIAAIHLVYAVAQYQPTDNGLYLQYVSDDVVRRYLDFTQRHHMLLFIDLQIGRSTVGAEVRKVLPYLRYPQVHLAIDPEFAVSGSEVPGIDLGSLRAQDIDEAQALLQQVVDEDGLPPKILIVHQFAESMVQDTAAIHPYDGVALVMDMDGFGAAAIKRAKYEALAAQPYAYHASIKLFFHHDPDMMSEADVLSLQPTPTIVIYQ